MRLLVEFKKHLDRHGVAISLNCRDAPLEILNASSGIADDLVQHYRERLLIDLPPVQRVYFPNGSQEMQTCEQCGRIVQPRNDPSSTHYATCLCGQVFRLVMSDERAYPRYPTYLPGVYYTDRGEDRMAEMVVEDVSYGGVRLQTLTTHDITHEDRLIIRFTLDDADRTIINERIRVCYVQALVISGQFIDQANLDHALVLYLGTKWVKAKPSASPASSALTSAAAD